jgi:hypothetical protein
VWWVSSHALATVWAPLAMPAALIPWHMLTVSLGMGALLFAVFGVFMGGRRALMLSIPLGALYILHAFTAAQYARHYLVLFPFVAVLSGAWATFFVTGGAPGIAVRRRIVEIGLACAVFVGIVIFPMADVSLAFLRQFMVVNTRTAAGEWIARHVPKGARLALVAEPWQYTTPPLDASRYQLILTGYSLDKLEAERPDYLVLSSADFVHPYGLSLPTRDKLEFLAGVKISEAVEKITLERPIAPSCRLFFAVGMTWPEDMLFTNPRIEIYRFTSSPKVPQ